MSNNLLKGIRVMNGLKQDDMAKILNITRVSYNRKENGKTEFTINEALAIAGTFNRKVDEIFFDIKCNTNDTKLII